MSENMRYQHDDALMLEGTVEALVEVQDIMSIPWIAYLADTLHPSRLLPLVWQNAGLAAGGPNCSAGRTMR